MNIFTGLFRLSFVIAILFVLMFSSCFARNTQLYEGLFSEGQTLMEQGKYEKALVKFNEGLKLSQANKTMEAEVSFLEKIAQTYRKMRKYDKSIETYERTTSLYIKLKNLKRARISYSAMGSIYMSRNNYKKSLDYMNKALLIARLSKDKGEIGRALGNIANVYYLMGSYDSAARCYKGSIDLLIQTGDYINLEINIGNLGNVYSSRGDYKRAITFYSRSLEMAEKIKNPDALSRNLGNLGIAYSNLQEHEKGMDYLNKALKIARDSKLKKREVLWLGSIGNAYSRMGKKSEALVTFQEAVRKAKEIDDQWSVVNYQGNIGIIYLNTGEFRKAMQLFFNALDYAEKIGDKKSEANFLCNIGIVYENLGLLNQSLQYHRRALEKAREMGDKYSEGTFLGNIGNVYKQAGDHQKSEAYYRQALDIAVELDDLKGQGINLGNLGNSCFDQKKFKEALNYYEKALKIAMKTQNPIDEGIRLGNMAGAYRELGDFNKSLDFYNRALRLATQSGNTQSIILQYLGRGLTFEKLNKTDNAIADLVKAVEMVENVRGDLGVEEYKNSFSNRYIFIYEELIELLMLRNRSKDAMEYAERAKARSFLDIVGKSDSIKNKAKDKTLAEKELQLLSKIRELEKKLYTLPEDQRMEVSAEIKKTQKKHSEILEKLKINDSEYASLITVTPSSLENIRKTLHPDEVLVEYFTTENKTLVWIMSKDGFDSLTLSADSETVEKDVKDLREALQPENLKDTGAVAVKSCNKKLAQFHSKYYAPIENIIKKNSPTRGNIKRIIIIPHGMFHLVPFSALADFNGKYLIDKYEILTEPSASSFVLFRKRDKRKTGKFTGYALGNIDVNFNKTGNKNTQENRGGNSAISDDFNTFPPELRSDFKPLPGTKKEAEDISGEYRSKNQLADCYIEKDFTTRKVFETAPKAAVLHFATHGFISGRAKGRFSGLITADGFIYMMDIFKWKLNADMVVLSACKTGLGEVSVGDDVASLSRAFMQAGADNLIATLWSVQDDATRQLMVEFYREILTGSPIPTSLRNAQLKLKKQYPHPSFWSGFVVYGRGE